MIRSLKSIMLALIVVVGSTNMISVRSHAEASHEPTYHFEIVDQTIHAGQKVIVSVRLIQTSTEKAVTNAIISEPKLLMMMGKMQPMPAQVKVLSDDANGNYRFICDVTEPGNWELDLSAQVSTQKEPIHNTLNFQVVK